MAKMIHRHTQGEKEEGNSPWKSQPKTPIFNGNLEENQMRERERERLTERAKK